MLANLRDVYNGKTVLVTGHTGFKGSWLSVWLHTLGAKVVGYALDPSTEKDNFVMTRIGEKIVDLRGDIRDQARLDFVFKHYRPDFVFHLAAQPLVRLSYLRPVETYETNVIGTINVLEAIRQSESAKVGIMVTSDKCYENKEQIWGYKENDPLGGYDPYSSSKAAAEIAINSWRLSFMNPSDYASHGKAISSVRAGNVIGGGDWAQDRIIPDCIRALEAKKAIQIRSPQALRPWEHVLEPLYGYLMLAAKMDGEPSKYSGAWNFGPSQSSVLPVWDIASKLIASYGYGDLDDVSNPSDFHEAKLLMLEISKARFALGWTPTLDIDSSISMTVEWYKEYRRADVYKLCRAQIDQYCARVTMNEATRLPA